MNKNFLYLVVSIIVLVAGYFIYREKEPVSHPANLNASTHALQEQTTLGRSQEGKTALQLGLQQISTGFANHQGNFQVQAAGEVITVLPDDNKGSRHQRFILDLGNGLSVLVAHNIDLAPRIENLQKGDKVEFNGEYEYNPKGGVIHWTHHDPKAIHENGWLKHQGKIYQ